jgi:hypothetical protein
LVLINILVLPLLLLLLLLLLLCPQAHRDVTPTSLLMSAVEVALSRKALAEQISSTQANNAPSFDVSLVQRGRYLGQVVVRSPAGDGGLLSGHRCGVNGTLYADSLLMALYLLAALQEGPPGDLPAGVVGLEGLVRQSLQLQCLKSAEC